MQQELFEDQELLQANETPADDTPLLSAKEKRARTDKILLNFTIALQMNLAKHEAQDKEEPFDLDAFCEQKGYSYEELEDAIEYLNESQEKLHLTWQSFEVPPEDKDLEMPGYPLPSEEAKLDFDSYLEDSPLFEIFDSATTVEQFSTITGGSFDDQIKEDGLLSFIEELFDETFDEDISFTLMNSFFWILFYNGDRWLSVRSYAIEMLKLFPYPIQSHFVQTHTFIEKFSRFTRRRLATRGICSLQRRPTPWEMKNGLYTIKATDAFYSFLKPLTP